MNISNNKILITGGASGIGLGLTEGLLQANDTSGWQRVIRCSSPVADFIAAVFEQLQEGKTEITFGFSEAMAKAGADELKNAFARMNGSS